MLRREVAYLAFHFHWSHTEIMQLDHQQRREWFQEAIKLVASQSAK